MSKITGIGFCVYDTLINVDSFPEEDTKSRASDISHKGGGPCSTGLVAASKLGCSCDYIGVLADDEAGRFLAEDFRRFGVGTEHISMLEGYKSFVSYILLSASDSTRTCIAHPGNLPSLKLTDYDRRKIAGSDILMIDGNEIDAVVEACKVASENKTKVLYDAGSVYPGVERILPYADILIPSEDFARKTTGESDIAKAAEKLMCQYDPEVVVITEGRKGGVLAVRGENGVQRYEAFEVEAVDTNGAGDVFHGAFAASYLKGFGWQECCVLASGASALKCTRIGSRDGAPSYNELIEFMRRNGYEKFEEKLGS